MEHLAWTNMLLHTKRSFVYLKYQVYVKTMRNVDGWWPADQLEYQDHLLNRDGRDVNFSSLWLVSWSRSFSHIAWLQKSLVPLLLTLHQGTTNKVLWADAVRFESDTLALQRAPTQLCSTLQWLYIGILVLNRFS